MKKFSMSTDSEMTFPHTLRLGEKHLFEVNEAMIKATTRVLFPSPCRFVQ